MILRTCRMARRGGSYTQIQYSPAGFKMQLMNGQSYAKAWVPMPAGTAEVWQASGSAIYYQHADWLGSERFESTTSRTMYHDLAYAPFGEPYAQSGSGDIFFAGINQDTTTNLYDAQFREYGIQGRWPSPDPAGMAAVNPANPQSWNRYAYTLNNPHMFIDSLGLQQQLPPPCQVGVTVAGQNCSVVVYGSVGSGSGGGALGGFSNGGGGHYAPLQDIPDLPIGGFHSLEALEPQPPPTAKAPCTALSRTASALEALDDTGDAIIASNLAAIHFGAAFVLVSAGCFDPTPFEPLTCGAAAFGALSVSAGGVALTGLAVLQTGRAISAIKQTISCGPGS